MFVSRALRTTQSGHRYTSSAKFTNTREINHDQGNDLLTNCLLMVNFI